jgi:CMP-N,N'-diacetyllegionaminic acid synthase
VKTLYLIPARGGSKGLPGKNIKLLVGKPLINYAVDLARCFAEDDDICVSTDSEEIANVAKSNKLSVPFIRPGELSSDTAGTYEVMLHAIKHYEERGKNYDALVLLQPTSPLRLKKHLSEALAAFNSDAEMVVSVAEARTNPYLNLFKENDQAWLEKVFPAAFSRRQDAPKFFEYNGAIYVISVPELKKKTLGDFKKVKKIEMDSFHSVDIDNEIDFAWANFLMDKQHVKLDY